MSIENTLAKLDGALGKNKPKGRVDFKEIAEQRKQKIHKLKEGKNNIAVICPEGIDDPFLLWGYHNGLQEVTWYSVPCNHFNSGEECPVCDTVKNLQDEDWKGNRTVWQPIQKRIEYYVPCINLESESTINEGLKWVKLPASGMKSITEWLRNLENGEEPFFSDEQPQKLIITYTKNVDPSAQYNFDKKNMKPFPTEQLSKWKSELIDLKTLFVPKSDEEIKKMLDAYFNRVAETIADSVQENSDSEETPPEEIAVNPEVTSKLNSLKKK